MSLNLVIVNDFAHVNGGSAQVALGSAISLARRGHNVTLFAAVAPVDPNLEAAGVRVLLTEQFDIKSDPNRTRAVIQGVWNAKAAKQFASLLSKCDPSATIVHLHGWCKALSSSVVPEAVTRGFSVVLTLHDYFFSCPGGGFFNFQTRGPCHLRPLSAACLLTNCDRDGYPQKLWRSLRQGVQNRFGWFSELRTFITLSDFSEQVLRPYLPASAKLYRVPNPIAVEPQPPVDVGCNDQFVAIGRIAPEKGFDLAAQAAAGLACKLTIIGDGPSRDEVSSIYPHTSITGWKPSAEVERHLRSARALVFPSVCYEAQPLAVGEAAAIGVPAIVPEQSAAREWVSDGITGLWFESGNADDLRGKMATLLDAKTASRMGLAAYDRYWRHPFTMQRHIENLEACYGSMLGCAQSVRESLSALEQNQPLGGVIDIPQR